MKKIKDMAYYLAEWQKLNARFVRTVIKNYKFSKRTNITYGESFEIEFLSDVKPVFVLSTGRCGTEFLTKILNKIIGFDVYHSPKPEMIFFTKYAYANYNKATEEIKNILKAARLELILESYLRNRRYIETNNLITFFAYAAAEVFPRAKFIHLVRHPASFVRSGIRRNWYSGDNLHDLGRIKPLRNSENFNRMSKIEKIGWLWNETNQFIENFKKNIDENRRILFMKSEDMFTNIDRLQDIFQFLEVNVERKYLVNQISRKPVNRQKSGDFPPFDKWSDDDKIKLKKVCTLAGFYEYQL